jgi:hypothetical protein
MCLMETASTETLRTHAIGFVTDAKQMLKAAELLHESGEWTVTFPTYYLLGHAIEVVLKAFLLASGEDLKKLKNKPYGHDIAKAAESVVEANHNFISPLVQEYLPDIELLSGYYKAKELEYRVTGFKSFPQKERLLAFLQAVIPLIEPLAYQVYPAR